MKIHFINHDKLKYFSKMRCFLDNSNTDYRSSEFSSAECLRLEITR